MYMYFYLEVLSGFFKIVFIDVDNLSVCLCMCLCVCMCDPSGHVVSWLHLWRGDKRDGAVPWD